MPRPSHVFQRFTQKIGWNVENHGKPGYEATMKCRQCYIIESLNCGYQDFTFFLPPTESPGVQACAAVQWAHSASKLPWGEPNWPLPLSASTNGGTCLSAGNAELQGDRRVLSGTALFLSAGSLSTISKLHYWGQVMHKLGHYLSFLALRYNR